MNRVFAYLITDKLYNNANYHPLCNRNWRFAIYKSLLVINAGDTEDILWTKYNQWKVDHNYRAAKSAGVLRKTKMSEFSLTQIDNDTVTISALFITDEIETKFVCKYARIGFQKGLWQNKNPKGETILSGVYEKDELYEASLKIGINKEIEPTDSVTNKSKDNLNRHEEKRMAKFKGLKTILDSVRDSYINSKDNNEKSFIEVVVGAAIFYLPTLNNQFAGQITVNALKGYLAGSRLVKDHIYPRKLAASKLLSKAYSLEEIIDEYQEILSQFMYVTATENSLLVNYYENHNNHQEALEALNIERFPKLDQDKFTSHKELFSFISFIEKENIATYTLNELTRLLQEFRNK